MCLIGRFLLLNVLTNNIGAPPHDEAKYDKDHNALPHSLALTVGYLRLRMVMKDVPLEPEDKLFNR